MLERARKWGGIALGVAILFGLSRIGYGVEHSIVTRSRAEAFAARYPVRTELEVYHEPGRPQYVVLVRVNAAAPTWIALGVGLALGVLPLALYLTGSRER